MADDCKHSGFWVCPKCGKMREHEGNGFGDEDEICPGQDDPATDPLYDFDDRD